VKPLIEFHNAQLGYGRRDIVLRDVNLRMARGEFLAIVGANGSGKTTLLRTLLGLLKPVVGTVTVGDGEPVRYGYVPQRETVDTLFPIPVEEIVLMGRYPQIGLGRRPRRLDFEIARACLAQVGIDSLAARSYTELSGGQKQRVLIARALATEPDLMVLDEPTHGMDLASEHDLLALIHRLNAERGLTVVLVSHLLANVADCARRIAIIAEGRLEVGTREEMLTGERLSGLYGKDVHVYDIEGRCAILVRNGHR
jgi:ABC-type Mn2+/Zn2+ transport system ATPase subunit